MMKTMSARYKEGGTQYRIIAKYGIDYDFARKYNQAAFFSLTADIDRLSGTRWMNEGGGCCHDSIVKRLPDLAPLVQWHLVSTDGPLHYLANALYWMDFIKGIYKLKPESNVKDPGRSITVEAFKNTVVWGAIPGDTDADLEKMTGAGDRALVGDMLQARLPALMEKFLSVMKQWGVLE